MPFSRLLVSVVVLLSVAALTQTPGAAHAAGERKAKGRHETGRSKQGRAQHPPPRQVAPSEASNGRRGAHVLEPSERKNLRQSVYDARELYQGS
jgi:hypothetical protein